MKKRKITDYDLKQFCVYYSMQVGAVEDATRFQNALAMRYYCHTRDSYGLYRRCIKCRLIEEKAGNVVFKSARPHNCREVK